MVTMATMSNSENLNIAYYKKIDKTVKTQMKYRI